jgi:hypothetical protein
MSAEKTRTDLKRIKNMKEEEIGLTDSPELGADFFQDAVPWCDSPVSSLPGKPARKSKAGLGR